MVKSNALRGVLDAFTVIFVIVMFLGLLPVLIGMLIHIRDFFELGRLPEFYNNYILRVMRFMGL